MGPVLSVIVPIYNSKEHLPRCIESVLSQSFSDFELLLVDDGSTDGSGAICDAYSAKDDRVRVFHKANGGASSARNVGLENVKGQWLTFLDSDDWFEENYFQVPFDSDVDLLYQNRILSDGSPDGYLSEQKQKAVISWLFWSITPTLIFSELRFVFFTDTISLRITESDLRKESDLPKTVCL